MASTSLPYESEESDNSDESPPPGIVDDTANHRLVSVVDGAVAELVYELDGDRLTLVHTGVPEAIGHRGIAGALVRAAAQWAARDHLTLVPHCPYARRWLRDHPDVVAGLQVDWSARAHDARRGIDDGAREQGGR